MGIQHDRLAGVHGLQRRQKPTADAQLDASRPQHGIMSTFNINKREKRTGR